MTYHLDDLSATDLYEAELNRFVCSFWKGTLSFAHRVKPALSRKIRYLYLSKLDLYGDVYGLNSEIVCKSWHIFFASIRQQSAIGGVAALTGFVLRYTSPSFGVIRTNNPRRWNSLRRCRLPLLRTSLGDFFRLNSRSQKPTLKDIFWVCFS